MMFMFIAFLMETGTFTSTKGQVNREYLGLGPVAQLVGVWSH